jgi:hypothetical protein
MIDESWCALENEGKQGVEAVPALEELAPLEQVPPVRRQVRVLYEFQEVPFRVSHEDRVNSLANFDWSFADQVDAVLLQPAGDLVDIRDDKCDVGDALPLEDPVRTLPQGQDGLLGLDQLDSFAVRGLQTDDAKAVGPGSEFCTHLRSRLGVGGESEPENSGIEIKHAVDVDAHDSRLERRHHPQRPRIPGLSVHL